MGSGGLLAGAPMMPSAAILGRPTTTCAYSSSGGTTTAGSGRDPPVVRTSRLPLRSGTGGLGGAASDGDGMTIITRGRSASKQQGSRHLQFVSNLDAAHVEAEVAKAYTMTQFCDKMIQVFLYEKPQSKDWRKLLMFRDEWNKYRKSFYQRLQVRAGIQKDAIVKQKLTSLATKIMKVDDEIQRYTDLLKEIQQNPTDINTVVAKRRKEFTGDFFRHISPLSETYDSLEDQDAMIRLGTKCLSAVCAYDNAVQSIDMLETAQSKFDDILNSASLEEACEKIKSLAKAKELDSSIILLINRVWVLVKESPTMTNEVTIDRRCLETGELVCQDKDHEFVEYLKYFERRFLYSPGCWYPFRLPTSTEEKTSLLESVNFVVNDVNVDSEVLKQNVVMDCINGVIPSEVIALAKEAVLASREAASLAEEHPFSAHVNGFYFPCQGPKDSAREHIRVEEATVRSKRFLERRSKRRRMPNKKTAVINDSAACSLSTEMSKKISKGLDSNDPLRLFLWGPETKQLLTVKEEKYLFNKIQDLMRLEEVKQKLHLQFGHEPTVTEWAEAVGMTCHVLQSCLYSGNRSREKMIYANLRLVVHVAKQYRGTGLNIQDLLQEGSMGLMRSLEKFKPKAGCRFPTYAYWWIRQSIRKAIFKNSRIIRLPENVFALLKKIKDVRKLYIQEGHVPSNEELARRVGITKERLEMVLASSRTPVSIQGPAWMHQDVTVQEITSDPKVEAPEFSVAKQMMRQHVRNLLCVLSPRDRRIIQLRYGIGGGEPKSLPDIGAVFGLSMERVRQLENRALDRLKERLTGHGLDAYVDLLI